MPTPRTAFSAKYPVAAFMDTAMEAKIEINRLRRKAERISARAAQFPLHTGDEIFQEMRDILCQELSWVLADIQRCEERINEVSELIDLLPYEDERAMMRVYYLDGLRGSQMALKVHEDYGAYFAESYLEKKFSRALEVIQSIYEMEVLYGHLNF